MKIAMYYSRPFETGGIEKTMYNRGKMLTEQGYDITYVYCSFDMPLDTLEKWSGVGDVIHADYCNEHFDFAIYDSIHNIKKISADKYIQVINGCLIEGEEGYKKTIFFDDYIAVSEEAKRQFEKLVNAECTIIPNIIDSNMIKKLSKEKYDIPKAKYNFVTVSRLDKNKGFERVEIILKELEKLGVDYNWIFVGSNYLYPFYGESIKKKFSKYKTLFVGKQDNPYKYIANADYLVQLSDYESQCMVMYEALILGTPVIATDFANAVMELSDGKKGLVLKKDLSNLNIRKILDLKKNFEYKYPDIRKEWLKVLKPYEKRNIKFSIVIPNYNNEIWLKKCLSSVLNQTYKNYEIIFVDDKSTDDSVKIASSLLKEHKVIVLNQKRYNGGARNVGILESSGDYIMCLDSDDWLKNDEVLEMLNKKIRNEDLVLTGFDLFDGKNENLYPYVPQNKNLFDVFMNNVCAIWTKVVKASILKDTLMPEGTLCEDKVHHYRVVEKCRSFLNVEKSTHVWNRANKSSVTTKRDVFWEASAIKHLAEMYLFIKTTNNTESKSLN